MIKKNIYKKANLSEEINSNLEEEVELGNYSELKYIDCLMNNNILVQVYFLGGLRIVGYIVGYDDFTIALNTRSNGVQLVYKHSITAIAKHISKEKTFNI
jgi:RNA chaperone Hfq